MPSLESKQINKWKAQKKAMLNQFSVQARQCSDVSVKSPDIKLDSKETLLCLLYNKAYNRTFPIGNRMYDKPWEHRG